MRVMISGQWRPVSDATALLDRLLNHPGHADQKSHGRGGGGEVQAPPATGKDALAAVPRGFNGRTRAGKMDPRPDGMSDEEYAAATTSLRSYQNGEYKQITTQMRTGSVAPGRPGQPARDHTEDIGRIQDVMDRSRLDQDIVVHRGLTQADSTLRAMGIDTSKPLVGQVATEHSFMSTAYSHRSAARFTHRPGTASFEGATMEIRVPKGTGALKLTGYGEREILLQSGLQLRVIGETTLSGGLRHIIVEASAP